MPSTPCTRASTPTCSSTASTASRLVPDIMPMYIRADCAAMPLLTGDLHCVLVGRPGDSRPSKQLNVIAVLCHNRIKLLAVVGAERAGYRKIDRQRVDRFVVDAEFVMQVRPCRPACRADVANVITLADLDAFLDAFGEAFLVSVQRSDVVVML